jgi:hypothetical protein
MAAAFAGSVPLPVSFSKRPPLVLSRRRLEANRRNAARSTGPRTSNGKARVARNAIKHGFFADAERWTEQQRCDFADTFAGLCGDFEPRSEREQVCVAIVADSWVRMAAVWRYEGIAALKYHQQCERALKDRIAAADATEAARLQADREKLRRAGLSRPTIPGPREAAAIIRYEGKLHRTIRGAIAELEGFRAARTAFASSAKEPKQTHFVQENQGISKSRRWKSGATDAPAGHRRETLSSGVLSRCGEGPQTPQSSLSESAKTKPLNPISPGNRHERRRAAARARRKT